MRKKQLNLFENNPAPEAGSLSAFVAKQPALFGVYSEKAALANGTCVWRTIKGKEITVTAVSTLKDLDSYLWDDMVVLDQVTTFVRSSWR